MHLFAYGTLMFPEVWRRVVGRDFRTQRATVNGYVALRATGQLFPVLVPADVEETLAGLVYFDLDDSVFAMLDEFESDLYDRSSVDVVLEDGRTLACQAYVLPERNRQFASSQRWDSVWFEREAMAEYVRQLRR
jgi:gamma-glutamylcyclotransferase (GGCT)/AIG2-like uncharacterized protein YtfP